MANSFDLPPLPWPDIEAWLEVSSSEEIAAGIRAYARAAIEAERVKLLEAFKLEHLYQGGCPDEFSDPRRDPNCPACRALVALGIGEFT